jgi:SAM-dependent methyltransferase
MTCLDLGCGAGHVSRRLASLVGPSGRVVGLDLDAVKLAKARAESAWAGLRNIEFRAADVTAWAESATYDIVYGRFILSHLADRPAFVARLYDGVRADGTLILEDTDFTGSFCYPPNPAYARYCELYSAVIGRRGGDANMGAQLYQLCLDAGLRGVHVQVVQPVHSGRAPEKGLALSTLVNIADAILAEGLATPEELQETVAALTTFTEDARSVIALPRVFQVWGQRPSHGR